MRKEEGESKPPNMRKATGREKTHIGKYAAAGLCRDIQEEKRKRIISNGMCIVGMHNFHPMLELSPTLTLEQVISVFHGYVLSLQQYFKLLIKTENRIFMYRISCVIRILLCL